MDRPVQSRYDARMTTAIPPRTLSPARERKLLDAAAREFAAAGFEGASLNKVIRACGMSKSSFYHYFDSRQALFDHVIDKAAAALAHDLDAPDPATLKGPAFWPRLEAFVAHAVTAAAKPSWYARLGKLFYLSDIPAERSPALRRLLASANAWVQSVLEVGRACGAVRDDLPASLQAELVFAVLRAMDRWSLHHMRDFDDKAFAELTRRQFETLRRLLAPDPA